jgi:hypothetical protein
MGLILKFLVIFDLVHFIILRSVYKIITELWLITYFSFFGSSSLDSPIHVIKKYFQRPTLTSNQIQKELSSSLTKTHSILTDCIVHI